MSSVLVSMGYKMGDVLWSLATAKALADKHQTPVDYATSNYCSPLLELIQSQSYIDKAFTHEPFDHLINGNPRYMWNQECLVPGDWEHQYALRFERFPDTHIPRYFARQAGLDPSSITLGIELPDQIRTPVKDYIVINNNPGLSIEGPGRKTEFFEKLINKSPYKVVQVGSLEDSIDAPKSINLCGQANMYETAQILSRAKALVTIPSANAVLASLVGCTQHLLATNLFITGNHIFGSVGRVHLYAVDAADDLLAEAVLKNLNKDNQ